MKAKELEYGPRWRKIPVSLWAKKLQECTRCNSNKAAMVAQNIVTSKCQTKVKYEWNNGCILKCSDIQMVENLNVQIFKCPDI